jgi:plastocyanin
MFSRIHVRHFCCLLIALLGASSAMAAEILVNVVGEDGAPVADVAVFIKQGGLTSTDGREPAAAIMDQREMRFVPHILIVEKGALVEFPNSDVVAHHVYSFSRPNNFVLPLYKGTPPSPIDFANEGVVTVGCNIHDGMLGYIAVVDTDVFAMTDEAGQASLTVNDDASSYEINIWSPRIRDSRGPIAQTVASVSGDGITFKLKKSLRPAHVDQSESVQWNEY